MGVWILLAVMTSGSGHVTPLESFTDEATCRAKVERVSRANPRTGIPAAPPGWYQCWTRDMLPERHKNWTDR